MKPATKTARFELLLPPELKELWGRAAEAEGLDLSSFVRRAVTREANRVLWEAAMQKVQASDSNVADQAYAGCE